MDADFKEKRRQRLSSQREKRWSMNSQRLDEIVAELMKPISDLRRSFDTNLSELLEEYLTEAGLRALGDSGDNSPQPNFAELALLLQYSASAYSRKVDFLYQNVVSISDGLQIASMEMEMCLSGEGEGEGGAGAAGCGQTPGGRRRRAAADPSALDQFGPIALLRAGAATRVSGPLPPPPTLPRPYIELGPRTPATGAVPLTDYGGEPIGYLQDFGCCWPLRAGQITEGLARHNATHTPLKPIPLHELQQAIELAAPPPLERITPPPLPLDDDNDRDVEGVEQEIEIEGEGEKQEEIEQCMPPPLLPPRRPHKRKGGGDEEELAELAAAASKLRVTPELLSACRSEFSLPAEWIQSVVSRRSLSILSLRRSLRAARRHEGPLRGFDYSADDTLGFSGWSVAEALEAETTLSAAAVAASAARGLSDSDDDGFFEQSSSGESDSCPLSLPLHSSTMVSSTVSNSLPPDEWSSWQEAVARRAVEAAARGQVDLTQLADTLMGALETPEGLGGDHPERLFTDVLADTAKHPTDVSRLFLTTLFLANSGNVKVIQGAPLSVNTCSLRLITRDEARYKAVLEEPLIAATAASTVSATADVSAMSATPGPNPGMSAMSTSTPLTSTPSRRAAKRPRPHR